MINNGLAGYGVFSLAVDSHESADSVCGEQMMVCARALMRVSNGSSCPALAQGTADHRRKGRSISLDRRDRRTEA